MTVCRNAVYSFVCDRLWHNNAPISTRGAAYVGLLALTDDCVDGISGCMMHT